MTLEDCSSGSITLRGTGGSELAGELSLTGQAPIAGRIFRLDREAGTLAFVPDSGGGQSVLHPVTSFVQDDVGAYVRHRDDATVIFANDLGLDGITGSFSVLDAEGYWPEDLRYRAYLWNGHEPLLKDTFLTAARFDGGSRIYACFQNRDNYEDECGLLSRLADSPEHRELGGVFMGREKVYDHMPEWFLAVVVEHGGALYVHERGEKYLDNTLRPELRAVLEARTGHYVDTDRETAVWWTDWRARPGPGGTWLFGEYEDDDPGYRRFHAMQRIARPPAGYLTGEAWSISADWFDAPYGIPEPVLGRASIVQEGDLLTVLDESEDGETYTLEARFTGYQYEGFWWNISQPEVTSPWRGQLTSDGAYLHGTWEKGEYSFSQAPMMNQGELMETMASASAENEDKPVAMVSLDAFEDVALSVLDPASGQALTIYRRGVNLSHQTLVDVTGEQTTTRYDERWRIVEIRTPENQVLMDWADDMRSVTVTVDGGEPETVPVDTSDEALAALADEMSLETGLDNAEFKEFLSENPGLLGAILRGEIHAPWLVPPPLEEGWLKSRKNLTWTGLSLLGNFVTTFGQERWPNASKIVSNLFFASACISFAGSLLAHKGALVVLFTYAAFVLHVAAVVIAFLVIANLAIWLFGGKCDPCDILCFVNCTAS